MTALLLVPIWKRPEVTRIMLNNLPRTIERFKANGIELIPYFTVSCTDGLALMKEYKYDYIALPNNPIGAKLDMAIRHCPHDFDYLIGLGSDNIILDSGIDIISNGINTGIKCGGFSDIVFIHGNRMKLFHSNVMFGAGRWVNRFLLDAAMRSGELYGDIDKALDGASFRAIKRTGFTDFRYFRGNHVIDIKSDTNINKFDAYPCKEQPLSEKFAKYLTA